MNKLVSLEEYKRIATEKIREGLSAFPKKEVEDYINSLQKDMEDSYNDELEVMDITDCPPSASGYAYGKVLDF